jgi:hypothetical protein
MCQASDPLNAHIAMALNALKSIHRARVVIDAIEERARRRREKERTCEARQCAQLAPVSGPRVLGGRKRKPWSGRQVRRSRRGVDVPPTPNSMPP